MKKISQMLNVLESMSKEIEFLKRELLNSVQSQEPTPHIMALHEIKENEIKQLLNRPEWPVAVAPELLCDSNSEEDKFFRSQEILDIIIEYNLSPQDKICLDFGCGEGHLAKTMSETAKFVMGYDIKPQWSITSNSKLQFSNDFEEVKKYAPYQLIILYDVLDHAESETPVDILKKIASLLDEKGLIFIRCHPWCCRHGAHLYKQLNKAFVQLFFTTEELEKMGYQLSPIIKVIYPVKTYKLWIKDSGLQFITTKVHQTNVEKFFKQKILFNFIKAIWGEDDLPTQMQVDFADMVAKAALSK